MKRTLRKRRRRSRRLHKQGEIEGEEEEEEEEEERERAVREKGKGRRREDCADPTLPGTSERDRERQSSARSPPNLPLPVPLSRVAADSPSVCSRTSGVVGKITEIAGALRAVPLPMQLSHSSTDPGHLNLSLQVPFRQGIETECRQTIEAHHNRHQPPENNTIMEQDRVKEEDEEEEEEEEEAEGDEEVGNGMERLEESSFGGHLFGFMPNWSTLEVPSHSTRAVDGRQAPHHAHMDSGYTPCPHLAAHNNLPSVHGEFQLVPTMSSSRGFSVNVEITGRPRHGVRNTIDLSVEMGEVRGREGEGGGEGGKEGRREEEGGRGREREEGKGRGLGNNAPIYFKV